MRSKSLGFTLIELMIALAIVGILGAVAFPAYKYQIRKGHRSAAEAAMMDIANREQQYLLNNRSFATQNTSNTDTVFESATGYSLPTDVSKNYSYAITTGSTPPTFTITFTPKGTSVMSGDGNLTLDSNGNKSSNW